MLKISLVVVGNKMPEWVDMGYREYEKRIHGRISLKLTEIAAEKRTKNADIARVVLKEEKKIRDSIADGVWTIAMDRTGKSWSTMGLANKMKGWLDRGQNITLVVGGPEGLSDQFLKESDEVWSLSDLTFAHPLVRLIIAEQLYRGFSIFEGAPYHR